MSDGRLTRYYWGKRVLVTGGASFIGSHLTELLVKSGASVTVADDLSSGKFENLSAVAKKTVFLKGDLRAPAFARAVCDRQEVVFHLAAAHGGRGFIETHPVECVNNMALDHEVFASAVAGGTKKIVFASSACVYPTTLQASDKKLLLLKESDAGFDEPGKAFSDGEYGWAKLMGELQLRAFCKQFGISGVACRIFTAYGERENESHAVIALIAKALAKLDPYPVWGTGSQTRNFTYVQDTVMGMALAGALLDGFQTINVGTETHHTILDLLGVIFQCVGWRPAEIKKELDKPVGVLSRAADNARCREVLNWVAEYPLAEGIRRTASWYAKSMSADRLSRLGRLLMERNG